LFCMEYKIYFNLLERGYDGDYLYVSIHLLRGDNKHRSYEEGKGKDIMKFCSFMKWKICSFFNFVVFGIVCGFY